MTGIIRVIKAGIFSDLNNLKIYIQKKQNPLKNKDNIQ